MEKLTCAFWIWGIFGEVYDDFDQRMKELRDRGFNCVRLEDGAGLMCRPDGTPRGDVCIYKPFDQYTDRIRQFAAVKEDRKINLRKKLIELFTAAEKYDVSIILSTWFYMHTNWFYDSEINDELFALTVDEKFEYFSDELIRILDLLRENNLIHRVAFAELFNEFDGQDFAVNLTPEEQEHLKMIHEQAIDKVKKKHPDILMACDTVAPWACDKIMPSNVDVYNFHAYYAWRTYDFLEKEFISSNKLPEQMKKFMKQEISEEDFIASFRGRNVKIDEAWARRVRLYAALDPDKMLELEQLLTDSFNENYDYFVHRLEFGLNWAIDLRDRVMPNARLFMGEGVSYCTGEHLHFEEKIPKYRELIRRQAELYNKNDLLGTVVRTTSGPEDVSWDAFSEFYKEVNELFLG